MVMACTYSLSNVVLELAIRAGADPRHLDVTRLQEQQVRGFTVINTYPCAGALQSLSQVFFFDPANYDGVVHFLPRGSDTVATVTEDDMLDDTDDTIESEKRSDAIAIPRVLHLNYFDIDGGLATDKQTSERSGDRRATGESSLQTPVLMNADEAARAVVINHKVAIESHRGELKFRLPDSFLHLVASDCVFLQWQGKTERVMLQGADTFDGYQEYVAVRDRQSAYTSNVEGFPAAPQTPPPSNVVGPTLLAVMDIHILRDADDNIGLSYYAAVSGLFPAWQGALIELSLDGGANYVDSTTARVSAIMGESLSELPDHPQDFPDQTHVLRVRIDTPHAELFATNFAGVLNRKNLALLGTELIAFVDADEVVPGVWDLSFLLRGRKGSQTVGHAPGERFVLLERSFIGLVPASILDVGRTLTFRATSFGTALEDGTVVSMVYTGRSQIERQPAYLTARRDGTDAIVEWQGVGRLGGGAQVAHGARFTGYRVTIEDGVLPAVVVDTPDQSLTQDVSGLGAPLIIQVQQVNDLMGAGPAAEVELA